MLQATTQFLGRTKRPNRDDSGRTCNTSTSAVETFESSEEYTQGFWILFLHVPSCVFSVICTGDLQGRSRFIFTRGSGNKWTI